MADHASQHQDLHTDSAAITRNLNESPLARLARAEAGQGAPFLLPHQIEAGERLRHMVARAQLVARTTMSYDASRTISAKAGPNLGAELGDTAIDARRRLDAIAKILAPDCAHVVFDVCGLLKGLQVVEQERGWPRRSAKLVLRIGLEQLASYFGLAAHSAGAAARGTYAWLETRPQKFE